MYNWHKHQDYITVTETVVVSPLSATNTSDTYAIPATAKVSLNGILSYPPT